MTLTVYSKTCSKNVSGNSRIFIAETANISAITVTSGEISGITGYDAFKEIEVDLDSIIRTEEKIAGKLNEVYDISLEMKLANPRMELNTLRDSLADASYCGMMALVKDGNGTWWLVGYSEDDGMTRPLYLSEDNFTSEAELINLEGNRASLKLMSSISSQSLPIDATLTADIDAGTAIFCEYVTDSGYCAEFQAVYDSWTIKPGAAIAAAMNTMVVSLIAAGVWAKLDVFYLMAAHTNTTNEALTNWISPGTYDFTNVHATAFTALEGFTGDGANDYLNTNFNPGDGGGPYNYLQDSACMGFYNRTNDLTNNKIFCGVLSGNSSYIMLRDTPLWQVRMNTTTSRTVAPLGAGFAGMTIHCRVAAFDIELYQNKTQFTITESSSTGLENEDIFVLAVNNAGTDSSWTLNQLACFFAGASLNQTEANAATDAIEVYMDSNGKGVIP